MQHPDHSERMTRLEDRIEKLKAKDAPKTSHQEEHYSQVQLAWRMVIELVAGVLIGFGMGYGLDKAFGTLPVFLVIFTLLGLAAGIRTMMRSARELQQTHSGQPTPRDDNSAARDGRRVMDKEG